MFRREMLLLSGGLVSSTLAALRCSGSGYRLPVVLTAATEEATPGEKAARAVCDHYALTHRVQNLGPAVAPDVANRDSALIMAAVGVAAEHGCTHVVTGHYDTTGRLPDFIAALATAAEIGTGRATTVEAPFARTSLARIGGLAHTLRVPLHLTWSCNDDGDLHCGRCPGCSARREALVGVEDPTDYAA